MPTAPPALLQVLLPQFLLFPVPEDPQGSCTWFNLPKATCLLLLCQTPVLLDWVLIPNGASVLHEAGGSAECLWQAVPSPRESCICSCCLLQTCPTDPYGLAQESLNDGDRAQCDAELELCVTASVSTNPESPRACTGALSISCPLCC